MQVSILGPLVVVDGARPVEVGGSRLRALLIRLAAAAGRWVPVGELVDALWWSDHPRDEVNSLQSLVSRLRRALPGPELIESSQSGYRLAIEPEQVDGLRFERLAGAGRRELAAGRPLEATALLDEALGLWRGIALAEVADAPYAVAWTQRLEKLRLAAIDERAEAGLRLGRHADVIAELEDTTLAHPLHQRSHELLIRALAGVGRQAEALAVHERLRRRMVDELGLDPPVHLQDLQAAVLRDDPALLMTSVAPQVVSARAAGSMRPSGNGAWRRTNLRPRLTSFVGREAELTRLVELIEGARLVTLVGTGGAGKTRLAGEAASRLRASGTDGVWMVELAPVTDPADVTSTALGSLGALDQPMPVRPGGGARDTLTRLIENVADHDVVLILDNCEHLIDAAAKLAEHLLVECPRLRVLATSREPLGIVGESLWPVQPLPVPAGSGQGSATDSAAVRLFLDRAALVRPGFDVTETTMAAVTEICRRLDGLPLAIELAAARLRTLSVEAIAARLGDRFRLLTGGNRTAMPRHQTLRAVVAWSWELLTDDERVLAERLSVFPGGATPEPAEAVCGDALPPGAVADLLIALADKSLLIVVEPTATGDATLPRYRMLETIREFAGESLAERGDPRPLRAAHARYFLELAETAEPRLRGRDQIGWLDRLTAERDNLLAALRFAAETGDAGTALRLSAALSWYWTLLGRHDEAAAWLNEALQVEGERPAEAYAIALVVHTISAAASGQGLPEEEQVNAMIKAVADLDVNTAHPMLALVEPGIQLLRDDNEAAQAALERNLSHPDPWARAMLHLMRAVLAENDGDAGTMTAELPLAIDGFRAIGDRWGIGTASSVLANLHAAQGDLDGAIAELDEAHRLMDELHAADDRSYALSRIGMVRLRQNDLEGARRDITAAVEMAERSGSPASEAYGTFALAMIAHLEDRTDDAEILAHRALAVSDRAVVAQPQVVAMIQGGLAMFEMARGELTSAAARLDAAHAAAVGSRDMPVVAQVATVAAELALRRGDPSLAATVLGAGIRLRGLDDVTDPDLRRIRGAVTDALGPTEFTRLHIAGQELSRQAALELVKPRT